MTDPVWAWGSLGLSLLVLGAYEWWVRRSSQAAPGAVARSAHARMRADWVRSIMARPGQELLAIQTLRNSLMSATIIGSTAALGLMGTLTLAQPLLRLPTTDQAGGLGAVLGLSFHGLLVAALLLTLFAAFVMSALAVRSYHHAGYLITTQASGSAPPEQVALAAAYVARAGYQYSLSLRAMFWLAPLVAGLVKPVLLLPATLGLVWVLAWFDRPPPELDAAP